MPDNLPLIGLAFIVGGLFVFASFTDIKKMIIPNWVSVAIIFGYVVRCFMAPSTTAIGMDIVAALVPFAIGFALYAAGGFGAGDVKLLTAGSLWFGQAHAMDFLLVMALIGGAASVLIVVWRRLRGSVGKASFPYGPAIGLGALNALFLQFTTWGLI
jgi:prepilin peptidase CpaA